MAKIDTLTFASLNIIGDGHIGAQELAKEILSLKQIYLNDSIWDVERESDLEEPALSKWSEDKWMFWDYFDFSSSEAFWLKTYHKT